VIRNREKLVLLALPPFLREMVGRIGQGEIGKRIVRGFFWSVSGAVISRGLMLLASIIVARILGKLHFGELSIIQSTVYMFTVFAGFGLGMTSTKYVAELRESDPLQAGNIIASSNLVAAVFGVVFTLLLILFAPCIATKTVNAPHLVNEIRLSAVILFFSAINGAQVGTLAGFEDFKALAKINIASGLIFIPVQFFLTYSLGLPGAILGLGVNFFLQWLFCLFAIRRSSKKFNINIRWNRSMKDVSYLWKFSLPAVLSGIIVGPVMWYCNTRMVSRFDGFNEMAVYNAAYQWQNIILFVPLAISQISLPLFSSSKNDLNKFILLIKYNIAINFLIGISLAVIFSLLSKFIMRSYGNDFADGWKVLVILSFTGVLVAVNSVIGQVIAGIGKMWIGFLLNLLWAAVFITLAIYNLDKGSGAYGMSLALLFAYIFHSFTTTCLVLIFLKRSKAKADLQYHPSV
jgi:O-antigen/teichoic acid export membrane protein